MIRRMLCIALAAAFLPLCASASDLPSAIAALPDEALVELYNMVALEMDHRGLPTDTTIEQTDARFISETADHASHLADVSLQDAAQAVQDIISDLPYTETFTTYDPPATPMPTYRAWANIQADDTVWISDQGHCYHTTPDCSGMKSPAGVSLASARLSGRSACKDCAWWLGSEEE